MAETAAPAEHPRLTEEQVIAGGGWHPRYARVLAIATDGNYGFALVDGNGDGAELEEEFWERRDEQWVGSVSSGGGPLDYLRPLHIWWPYAHVCFAWGRAPRRQAITLSLAGERYKVPVSDDAVWAFVRADPDLGIHGDPVLAG